MNPKYSLFFHLLAQVLAQSAVAALVPGGIYEKVFAAVVAVVGVIVAFYDTTQTNSNTPTPTPANNNTPTPTA